MPKIKSKQKIKRKKVKFSLEVVDVKIVLLMDDFNGLLAIIVY